jgi:hypothetical protein
LYLHICAVGHACFKKVRDDNSKKEPPQIIHTLFPLHIQSSISQRITMTDMLALRSSLDATCWLGRQQCCSLKRVPQYIVDGLSFLVSEDDTTVCLVARGWGLRAFCYTAGQPGIASSHEPPRCQGPPLPRTYPPPPSPLHRQGRRSAVAPFWRCFCVNETEGGLLCCSPGEY